MTEFGKIFILIYEIYYSFTGLLVLKRFEIHIKFSPTSPCMFYPNLEVHIKIVKKYRDYKFQEN